jgi:hypothetical protein
MIAALALAAAVFPVSPGESIQDALDLCAAGDTVLLLPGVHTGTGEHLASMDGGHNGIVLLGDRDAPETVVLSGSGLTGSVLDLDGFSAGALDASTILEGFTVENGESPELGGGVFFYHASPVLVAVRFTGCHAGSGGAVYIWRGGPTLVSCVFQDNTVSTSGAGAYVYASDGSSFLSCLFQGNSSNDDGGAVYLFHSSPTIRNCLFSDNYAWDNGGGVYCYAYSSPDLGWCTFHGNSTTYEGSAVYFRVGSQAEVHDCVITGNITPALWLDGGGDPRFSNNCVWGNPDGDWGNLPDPAGTGGNISQDPLLTEGYHLSQVQSGQPQDSPCVDAGSIPAAGAGLDIYWTRTDQVEDSGQADMGFHYGPAPQYTWVEPGEAASAGLRVTPVPAAGPVTVLHPSGTGRLVICDLSGRVVMERPADPRGCSILPVSGLPGGVYLILFSSPEENSSARFVIL